MQKDFTDCKFDYEIVRVVDPASPFYGQRLRIGTRSFDHNTERNPAQQYCYTGTLIDTPEAGSESFLESQLAAIEVA